MSALRLYIPLVGLPLLGLLAVLHAGQRLTAPPGLRGEWEVGAVSPPGASPATSRTCVAAASGMLHHLSIAQSGPRIEITLRNPEGSTWARADARVDSGAAMGELRGAGSTPCTGASRLTLEFSGRVPDSLTGTIVAPSCAHCPAVRFTATRQRHPRALD